MPPLHFRVTGMTCQSCVRTLRTHLTERVLCVETSATETTTASATASAASAAVVAHVDVSLEHGCLRVVLVQPTCAHALRTARPLLEASEWWGEAASTDDRAVVLTAATTGIAATADRDRDANEKLAQDVLERFFVDAISQVGFDATPCAENEPNVLRAFDDAVDIATLPSTTHMNEGGDYDDDDDDNAAHAKQAGAVSKAKLTIRGMTCASCSSTIERALRAVPGVRSCVVNLLLEHATIEFDPAVVPVDTLLETVDDVGFDATLESVVHAPAATAPSKKKQKQQMQQKAAPPTTLHFEVRGMTCASCSNTIQNALSALPFVERCTVNLLTEKAAVTLRAAGTNTDGDDDGVAAAKASTAGAIRARVKEIEETIEDIGFEAQQIVSSASHPKTVAAAAATADDKAESLLGESRDTTNDDDNASPATASADTAASKSTPSAPTATNGRATPSAPLESNIVRYRRMLLFSLVFAVPTFFFSMIGPSVHAIDSALSVRIVGDFPLQGLLLFLLCSPVQWLVGGTFFRPAYLSVRHGSANMAVLVTLGTLSAYLYATIGAIQMMVSSSSMHDDSNDLMMTGEPMSTMSTMSSSSSSTSAFGLTVMRGNMAALQFFETSSTLITFIVLGKYLEALAKGNTSEALNKLIQLQEAFATLLVFSGIKSKKKGETDGDADDDDDNADDSINADDDDENSNNNTIIGERVVNANTLRVNDVVKVVRGHKLPADGVVTFGTASVNESMITGESMPVDKRVGSKVIGGTIVEEGTLHVRVSTDPEQSTLRQIVRLMEDAQTSKAPIQAFADRLSGVFVPSVVALAILTLVVWSALAGSNSLPSYYNVADDGTFLFAFLFGLSVLVIACPCALGLATPTAVMVGTGVGAKLGILIKGGQALETAHHVSAFVFDKTGTLTVGKPQVNHFTALTRRFSTAELAFYLGSAELNSEHVLARACVEFAREQCRAVGVELVQPEDFRATSGMGLACRVQRRHVLVGNRAWLRQNACAAAPPAMEQCMADMELQGETALAMAIDRRVVAVVGLADNPKPESASVIAHLRRMNIRVMMCTGDNARTASVVARRLGLPAADVVAEALPSSKYELVRELQAQGHVVAMIGDGINDSPALAQADLGVSVGTGTDVAMEASDVVLMKNDLRDVITALDLSKRTFSRIRWNFVWAIGFNVVGIPVAAGLFYPLVQVRLPPELAAFAMAMSSVSVMMSSLSLKWYRKPTVKPREVAPIESVSVAVGAASSVTGAIVTQAGTESSQQSGSSGDASGTCCGCPDCSCCQDRASSVSSNGADAAAAAAITSSPVLAPLSFGARRPLLTVLTKVLKRGDSVETAAASSGSTLDFTSIEMTPLSGDGSACASPTAASTGRAILAAGGASSSSSALVSPRARCSCVCGQCCVVRPATVIA